jgi:hypothetical protein
VTRHTVVLGRSTWSRLCRVYAFILLGQLCIRSSNIQHGVATPTVWCGRRRAVKTVMTMECRLSQVDSDVSSARRRTAVGRPGCPTEHTTPESTISPLTDQNPSPSNRRERRQRRVQRQQPTGRATAPSPKPTIPGAPPPCERFEPLHPAALLGRLSEEQSWCLESLVRSADMPLYVKTGASDPLITDSYARGDKVPLARSGAAAHHGAAAG